MILVPTREQAEVIKAKIDAQCCRRQRCRNEYRAANTESLLITETNGTDIAGATFMHAFSTALTSRSYFDKKRLVKISASRTHIRIPSMLNEPRSHWPNGSQSFQPGARHRRLHAIVRSLSYCIGDAFRSLIFWRGQVRVGETSLPVHSLLFFGLDTRRTPALGPVVLSAVGCLDNDCDADSQGAAPFAVASLFLAQANLRSL